MPGRLIILFCFTFIFPMEGICQYKIYADSGKASFYSPKLHGYRTANGERLNNKNYTAAHRSLPFNTILKVTNLKNDSIVYVRVNDRGPFRHGRIIDLSYNAARRLDMVRHGIVNVNIETITVYNDSMALFNSHHQLTANADSITHPDTVVIKKDSAFYFKLSIDISDALQMDILLQFINNYHFLPFYMVQNFDGTLSTFNIYAGFCSSRREAESIAIFSGLDYIIRFFMN